MNFTEEERKVFRYERAGDEVAADPLDLLERTSEKAGDLNQLSSQASAYMLASDPVGLRRSLGAQERLSWAIRQGFGFPDFDKKTGKGATETQVFSAWDRFCRYLNGIKDSSRVAADDAAVYGILPSPMTYEAYMGLRLNADRAGRWWLGYVVAHAVAVAGGAELSAAMMDPIAKSDRQAEEMAFDANAERQFQKARQKAQSGGLPV